MATPNAFEQLTVELINQARLNPHGEYDRVVTNAPANVQNPIAFFGVDLVLLKQQFDALVPVAPVAWNDALGDSSHSHTQLMLDNDTQSHDLPGEPGLGARVTAAGYIWNRLGENIFAFAEDAFQSHAGFFIDWGGSAATGGIQSPPGHRNSIMRANFQEIGVGHIAGTGDGSGPGNTVGPNLVTHHFGGRNTYTSQIVGVIFNDADGDRFYDIGEGVGGATITAGATVANGFSTGGFNLDVAEGTHTLNFNSALGAASIIVSIGADNVKVDMSDPGTFRSSVSATLGAGGVTLQLLGEGAISATGNGGANTLIGNVGNNILDGGAGSDAAFFTGARADYTVTGSLTEALVVDNRAGSPDGSDTLRNMELLSFNGTVVALADLVAGSTTPTAGNDTLTGTTGDDTLDGLAGNDTINALAGFDTLIGGEGNDTLNGGANPTDQGDFLLGGPGDDTYHVDSPLDFVDEGNFPAFAVFGFGGADTIVSTADFFWDLYSIGETLRVSEDVVDAGNDGVTIVHSVFSGELIGHSGTDIMFGRGGSDAYRPGGGVDFMSFSTLGVPDAPGYVANGVNTLVMEVGNSYDIVFEFEVGRDKVNLEAFGLASTADVFARGFNDGAGSSYFVLGAGFDYLYMVGLELADLQASDFIV